MHLNGLSNASHQTKNDAFNVFPGALGWHIVDAIEHLRAVVPFMLITHNSFNTENILLLHISRTRTSSYFSNLLLFYSRFHGDQECYYEDDLRILASLTKKEHMKGNETMLDFRTSKFVLRISRDSYQLLKRHLQERQNNQIWSIVQEHLYIDIFDGMPRSKQQIDAMVGSLSGEAKREANKVKVCISWRLYT